MGKSWFTLGRCFRGRGNWFLAREFRLRIFARRLLAYDAASVKAADPNDSGAFRVCEKLRRPLVKLLGSDAYRSLLFRALAMASAEVPSLHGVQIKPDGVLERTGEPRPKLGSTGVDESQIALVAQLLGLLVAFIGRAVMMRLVRDIWPQINDGRL